MIIEPELVALQMPSVAVFITYNLSCLTATGNSPMTSFGRDLAICELKLI